MKVVRIDKWLWAVRVFKTRALATEACRKGRVIINGFEAKASKEVKAGDKVLVRKMPVIYNYEVKKVAEKRMGAKFVAEFLEDHTSIEELDKLNINESIFTRRDRGTGRPTKKDRRQLDDLADGIN